MTANDLTAWAGLVVALATIIGLILSVRSVLQKSAENVAAGRKTAYDDGIKEGERRAQSKIDRLESQLELRTSERDQARSDLGEFRSDHRDRRGRD